MTATLLCSVMATLLASPAYALEFVRKDRLGAGAMSYLLPSLPQGVTSRAQERPEPKTLSEKQVEAINKGRVELPKCTRAEGSMRIVEPDDGQALWASYGLPMPTRMLRSFVTESSCWTVLDRGVGFAAAQAERELAAGGHLQRGANLGGGQMLAADFILIPDILSQNTDAGGRNFGARGGGSAGGLGRLMFGGGGQSRQKTVSVMLTLVDSRTSEVLATSTGAAEVSDKQWQLMAAGSGQNGLASGQGSISAGAYENTEIGTVIRAAYHQAFHQMLFDLEPVDLLARVQAAPRATVQEQPAQVTAYSTGGTATMTTSAAPAQMEIDQHAAHAQIQLQQLQQLQQMRQPSHGPQPHPMQQPVSQQQIQLQLQQLQQMQQQIQMQQMQMQQQPQMQQPGVGMIPNTAAPINFAQAMPQQPAGQMLSEGGAQLVGAVVNGLQQGNMTQVLAQQVAGQVLPAGSAQLIAAAANGLQQGNMTQMLAQQVAGQVLPTGSAQLVGAVADGLQQGNLGQMATQLAAQALVPQGGNVAQLASGVLILKVPANFMAEAGGGNVLRVLQPGETLARLAFSAGGDMLQVRDSRGSIGWIAADTIADVINAQ
ncbi:CsgG/HfaB family protein [Stenotrophomonas koreensis]|uniref:CsgG/HfaB family protein n=1 Tax=Stenotrophomonas koreensis TaxID=266128 RepID=UPI001364A180|nr:CsgG/HfaB family protein [Stenotrophomonas koreensis]